MTDYKFRAWIKGEEMVKVKEVDLYGEKGLTGIVFQDKGGSTFIGKDDMELMQFTGRRDRKKTDIYEGDILQIKDVAIDFNGIKNPIEHTGLVHYSSSYASFIVCIKEKGLRYKGRVLHFKDILMKDTLVIGNIYENIGLLDRKEDKP